MRRIRAEGLGAARMERLRGASVAEMERSFCSRGDLLGKSCCAFPPPPLHGF